MIQGLALLVKYGQQSHAQRIAIPRARWMAFSISLIRWGLIVPAKGPRRRKDLSIILTEGYLSQRRLAERAAILDQSLSSLHSALERAR